LEGAEGQTDVIQSKMKMETTCSPLWAVKGVLLRRCLLADAFRSGKFIVQTFTLMLGQCACVYW